MANPLKLLDLKVTGFQFIEELPINAKPKKVWSAVVNPGKWFGFDPDPKKWPKHTFDPTPGGQWTVEFPDGAAALFFTVTLVDPLKLLRLSGQMGFTHLPVTCVTIFELQPQNDGKSTLLRLGQRTFGFVDADLQTRITGAWKKLLPNIKTLAEKPSK
jgi:uncharacterized protein YndB with AHSA1/START domain